MLSVAVYICESGSLLSIAMIFRSRNKGNRWGMGLNVMNRHILRNSYKNAIACAVMTYCIVIGSCSGRIRHRGLRLYTVGY